MITTLRITEWSRISCESLQADSRERIFATAEAWRVHNSLPSAPVSFQGPDGQELCTRQFVGVIEVDDVAIEIYPKLDAELLAASVDQPLSPRVKTETVMQNLLWMLEIANFQDLAETETAHLEEAPTSFFDLFAYLLGKNLLPELQRGIAHSYIAVEGDCRAVRGRIKVTEQLTRNWNRYDRINCAWDEFTPDIAINRLLKCACRFLAGRVNYSEAARLLKDCQSLLSDVENVDPASALRDASRCRFDRSQTRFSTAFDLARRLLKGIGHNLGVGTANTFVFLMDMNAVFEKYVHAVLQSHFSTNIEQQKFLGRLFDLPSGGIHQFADFFWKKDAAVWIGDAKYKHLARGQNKPLRFEQFDFDEELSEQKSMSEIAGRILDPNDVRQLTVYAELARRLTSIGCTAQLILLYPYVGDLSDCIANRAVAWNGSCFWLMPVQVKKLQRIADAIRFPAVKLMLA